jgi:DNA-directed RNA polymerase specialized sigma24 family protein
MNFEGGGRGAALHQVGETDPEGAFFSRIMDGKVLEAIDALPEESREVLVPSDVENLSYAEIAKVVGAPIGTVKSRLFRARRRDPARVTRAEGPAGRLSPARGRCRPD